MIRHIKYLLLLLPFCIASCNKQLDLEPTDTIIDPERTFRNVADLNGGLLGAYTQLTYNAIYSVSLVTDECTLPNENNLGRGVATYRWQIDPGSTTITGSFGEYYITIDRANRVLGAIDRVPAKGADIALKDRYRGEALALRAYCHFQLLQSYAEAYEPTAMGVPYMDTSIISFPARQSFGDVMAAIEKDLERASHLIPADADDNTRITLATVAAIRARAALYAKKWDDAITFSTTAINALPLASAANFPAIWQDTKNDEVIWKLKQVAGSDDPVGAVYYDGDIAYYAPSFELINSFDKDKDVRYGSYILFDDTRGDGTSQYLVNKYAGPSGNPGLADIKLFRTGEMYLIRAEALTEKNKVNDGANDLNTLRAARINGYVAQPFNSKDALITAIYTERFKELAFEGHRLFDLRRRGLSVTREPADAINAQGAILLKPGQKGYVFPIPDAETKANKNMKQNPGY